MKLANRILEAPAEAIDRAFDAPIEALNEALHIPKEWTTPENPRYEKYQTGLRRLEAGAMLCVGGLAAKAAGVEGGLDAAFLGWITVYLGGFKAVWNGIQMDQYV